MDFRLLVEPYGAAQAAERVDDEQAQVPVIGAVEWAGDAVAAVVNPAKAEEVKFEPDAIAELLVKYEVKLPKRVRP